MLALATLAGGPWALDRLRQVNAAWHGESADEALVCSYRLRTGLPCIGCGGTRAFQLTSRGEWRAAFTTNLLGASTGAERVAAGGGRRLVLAARADEDTAGVGGSRVCGAARRA